MPSPELNPSSSKNFRMLLKQVRSCHACADLPLGPRPIIQLSPASQLLIVGQAPGAKVHKSGVPWDDASGDRLREWLGIPYDVFYDEKKVAILPVGFCYPGTGKSGDLPPRRKCFSLWHHKLRDHLTDVRLTVLLGQYAQRAYLGRQRKSSLTETVRAWREYLPAFLPLPHSSPLNNLWLAKNRWFEKDLPEIRDVITKSLK